MALTEDYQDAGPFDDSWTSDALINCRKQCSAAIAKAKGEDHE